MDKPAGPTSHDAVAAARRALGIRRIGHTGTLDPFATGLLMLCIGPATRIAEYLSGLDKSYEATARIGIGTDTLDVTGKVVAETDAWRDLDSAGIVAAFEDQRGSRRQRPPTFSAKKVAGKRAYELARAGRPAQPEAAEVQIHALDVTAVEGPFVRFTLQCSSGTYVRAVARDAGERLSVGAHLTELRRTGIGRFRVGDAVPLDRLDDKAAVSAALLDPLAALAHLPVAELDPAETVRVRHGRPVPAGERGATPPSPPGALVALAHDGALVAVAESAGGLLRPRKVFP